MDGNGKNYTGWDNSDSETPHMWILASNIQIFMLNLKYLQNSETRKGPLRWEMP